LTEQVLRLFVASPGDVPDERRRVDLVVERLNSEFEGRVRIETVRWETPIIRPTKRFRDRFPKPPIATWSSLSFAPAWARSSRRHSRICLLASPIPAARPYSDMDQRQPRPNFFVAEARPRDLLVLAPVIVVMSFIAGIVYLW